MLKLLSNEKTIQMEQDHFQMPGYHINEYQLVLSPHEDLRHKIQKLKEEYAEKFDAPSAKYLKSFITLVRFHHLGMMEQKIIQRVQVISMGLAPFKVELKDYGSFPSHTVFINVTSKLPIQGLVKQLKTAQQLFKLNQENKPHFMDEPHIPIARKLKPWQYEQSWLEFKDRQFTGRFIADSMLLLKRPAGSRSAFQIAARFEFMNLPVTTMQGDLFSALSPVGGSRGLG